MEKLDQDNKILAELDRKLKPKSVSLVEAAAAAAGGHLSSSLPSLNAASAAATTAGILSSAVTTSSNLPKTATLNISGLGLDSLTSQLNKTIDILERSAAMSTAQGGGGSGAPTRPYSEAAIQHFAKSTHPLDELKAAEDIVDSIEIPNRGRAKVFIARYNYDPYKQSPNDNPDAEITLRAGDFILVFGGVDQDGFYTGELLDGRRGLVPSNFIEKVTGEDLFEFQASVLYGHKENESETNSFPPEFYDAIINETMGHTNFQHLLAPGKHLGIKKSLDRCLTMSALDDFHRINDYIDLEDDTEIDEDISDVEKAEQDAAKTTGKFAMKAHIIDIDNLDLVHSVPPPQRLILERQLHKSVLIGWLHPDCPRALIDHYQIYVDGVLKLTIPAGDRTKALVEGVDSSMVLSTRILWEHFGKHSCLCP